MSKRVIVKVQRPINSPDGPALIYDERRTHTVQCSLPSVAKRKMGDELKAFFWAHRKGQGWQIEDRAPWQEW